MKRVLVVGLVLASVASCRPGGRDDSSRQLTVFAASSLTESFTEIAHDFEQTYRGAHVTLHFGGSAALAEQVEQGAPADVLVTADEATMARVSDAGSPTLIARNRLSIVVEKGNPRKINGVADLARSDVVLVLCATQVPCGHLAATALAKANVSAAPRSLEENVKGVVSKVMLGEADAGIVYVTDLREAGDKVEGVTIANADDPELEAVYPVAVLGRTRESFLANAWKGFLIADFGQRVLRAHGFLPPK